MLSYNHRMIRLLTRTPNLCIHRTNSTATSYKKKKGNERRFDKDHFAIENTRNIGIIAHIDAGKTTVTERLLYLCGATRAMGDVDSGNTVTDFLDMERERGITIQSAAVTFAWRDHRINLIDTPGHVDFTVEVERCARVLDGVVTVLDASAGVQAQTLTVWKQASKFALPATFFINKIDKPNADFAKSLDSIQQRLGIRGLATACPMHTDGRLTGVIDLLTGLFCPIDAKQHDWAPCEGAVRDVYLREREELLYGLADVDGDFMATLLDQHGGEAHKVEQQLVTQALSRVTRSNAAAVVGCGSALRSAASVRPVLDSVCDFLPPPTERNLQLNKVFGKDLSALVFKIGHDKRRGQLSYARVYTGQLRNNTSVYNSNRGRAEGPIKVFIPYSDELQSTDRVEGGHIAVITGLQHTLTGDSLVLSESASHDAAHRMGDVHSDDVEHRGGGVVLAGIETPEPVYFCCVEPPTAGALHEFERALRELAIEDPSLKVRQDQETGQTVLETMGELHLEVVKDRLVRGYGLDVFVGPLQVGYREIIADEVVQTGSVEDTQGEQGRTHAASVTLRLKPSPGAGKFKGLTQSKSMLSSQTRPLRHDWIRALTEGCANALHHGPVLGFPVHDVEIEMEALVASGGRVNPAILSAAAHRCVGDALAASGARLLEPVMRVETTIDGADSALQPLLHELGRRRAQIEKVQGQDGGQSTIVLARLPLAEMEGLSSVVRTLCSGMANIHVQVDEYQPVSEFEQRSIVAKHRGGF